MTKLMLVESPAKARKIASFLDDGWRVEACRGHLRDLPPDALGVDVENDFQPTYALLPGASKHVKRLAKAAKRAEALYLATDPDREGEAIAWHLLALLKPKIPTHRVTFTAVTADAVHAAIDNPRPLDDDLVAAQTARRIVDRLVGYLVSPLACRALEGHFSAGRVQTAALRLVVERERDIANFTPQTRYTLALSLRTASDTPLTAELQTIKDGTPHFRGRATADKLAELLRGATAWVADVRHDERAKRPPPPFTTSTLQQAAATRLGFSPERTMTLAQALYTDGFITYHRTDGVSVAPEAVTAARAYIENTHGRTYLPDTPPTDSTKSAAAQYAHEALRPVDLTQEPNELDDASAALYTLIRDRFLASQMAPARDRLTWVTIQVGRSAGQPFPVTFQARGRRRLFAGFRAVYAETDNDDEQPMLPTLTAGDALRLAAVDVTESHTRPPARLTEGGLVAALETHGIGRPSTYAATVGLLGRKGYVTRRDGQLTPTPDGLRLHDYLTAHFPDLFALDYTARLESDLDAVAAGKQTQSALLRDFWTAFRPQLGAATAGGNRSPAPLLMRPQEA